MEYQSKILISIIGILYISLNQFAHADSWTSKSSMPSSSRVASAYFSLNNKGYISCGADFSGTLYNDLWEYDPTTDSWSQKTNLIGAVRDAACGFEINLLGYIFGGRDINDLSLNDLYEYDPNLNVWSSKPNAPLSLALSSVFVLSGSAFIGFGIIDESNGIYNSSWMKYNRFSNSWTSVATFPGTPRYGGVAMSIQGNGYAGEGTDQSVGFNDWYMYDTISNTWSPKANLPALGVAGAFSFAINNIGYIGAGANINNDVDILWSYNSSANSWLMKTNFSGGVREGGYCFVVNNLAYAGGGFDGDTMVFHDLWLYTPDNILSTQAVNALDEISIFPNPTAGPIHILNVDQDQVGSISIFNSRGGLIYYYSGKVIREIDLQGLSCGTYSLQILIGVKNKRILKLLIN